MNFKWYIIHVHSGYEEKIKVSLQERIEIEGLTDSFDQILVPTEQVVELVKGKKKESSRKFYPGYILVRMKLNEASWYLVSKTPKVSGFIGSKKKPVPISEKEAKQILDRIEAGKEKPRPKISFEVDDEIRVNSGPFTNFNGSIVEINAEKGKIKALVSIFGRSTPVELDFMQVSKT